MSTGTILLAQILMSSEQYFKRTATKFIWWDKEGLEHGHVEMSLLWFGCMNTYTCDNKASGEEKLGHGTFKRTSKMPVRKPKVESLQRTFLTPSF